MNDLSSSYSRNAVQLSSDQYSLLTESMTGVEDEDKTGAKWCKPGVLCILFTIATVVVFILAY